MQEIDTFTPSRRRFLERILTVSVVAVAAPSIVLGRLVPSLRVLDGVLAGRYRIDLNDARFAALAEVGGSMMLERMTGVTFRVVVTRMDASTFVAVDATCTHEGCTVNAVNPESNGRLICPCHGSQYLPDGTVVQGPAPRSLTQLETFFDGDSIVEVEIAGLVAGIDEASSGVHVGDVIVDRHARVVSLGVVLEHAADVRATMYAAGGDRVVDLERATLEAGEHQLRASVDGLAAGAYFVRISIGGRIVRTRKFVVSR